MYCHYETRNDGTLLGISNITQPFVVGKIKVPAVTPLLSSRSQQDYQFEGDKYKGLHVTAPPVPLPPPP